MKRGTKMTPEQRARCKAARAANQPTPEERFWAKVDKTAPGGCWLWTGAKHVRGYGLAWFDGKVRSTHRISLLIAGRALPEGDLVIDHTCRKTSCVNPDHLRYVTPRINAIENNSSPFAKNAAKTHCKDCGNPLSGSNVFWTVVKAKKPRGKNALATRMCMTCIRNKYPTTKRKPNTREEAFAHYRLTH